MVCRYIVSLCSEQALSLFTATDKLLKQTLLHSQHFNSLSISSCTDGSLKCKTFSRSIFTEGGVVWSSGFLFIRTKVIKMSSQLQSEA